MDVLDKIKKLLALSSSSNANEAAAALARAQELMEEYGIDHNTVVAAEVIEEEVVRRGGLKPQAYEVYLVSILARSFGCRVILQCSLIEENARWLFIGLSHRAEIAKYLCVVLLRKLAAARRNYLKDLYRCKRNTKVRRGDEFCLGWVSTVVQKIHVFAGSAEDETILDQYMKRHKDIVHSEIKARKSLSRYKDDDYFNGHRAARDVELQHGMNTVDKRQVLIGGNGC
jgi:hypothetical protein